MAGHLRTQSILVADVVGSTALENAIGRRAWQKLVTDIYGIARQATDAVGGRFLSTEGDGMWITFDSAIDAVTAATRVMQASVRLNRTEDLPQDLAMRVGITAGDVEWNESESDCTGIARNLAARLLSAAEPNQIVCSSIVPFLVGSDRRHTFARLGAGLLKDFEAVEVWTVRWLAPVAGPSQFGLPSELEANAPVEFVGRTAELASLAIAWEYSLLGSGRVVAVRGEAGLGKTAVCHRIAMKSLDDDGVVLYGRVDEHVSYPYQPFVEAIRDFIRRAPEIQTTLGSRASELSLIVPELLDLVHVEPPRPRDAATQRHLLFEAVATWIREIARANPVLLVLDDLTWADEQTLAMARHVARRVADEAALIIWTYRPEDANHYFRDARTDMERLRHFAELRLQGLGEHEVDELVSNWHEVSIDATGLWKHTGGNPFFVREALLDLARGGGGTPIAVQDLVAKRVRRLNSQTSEVLATAAVVGVSFDEIVVGESLGIDERAVSNAVAEAEEVALVRPLDAQGGEVSGWGFAHAIVRDAIYDQLPLARRRFLHRSLGNTLEQLREAGRIASSAADLAYHYALGGRDPAKTIAYSVEAAHDAQAKFAYDAEVRHYQRALAALPAELPREHGLTHAQLVFGLGVAQRRGGQPTLIEHKNQTVDTLLLAHRLAADIGDATLCAHAILAGSRGMFTSTGEQVEKRIEALQRSLDLLSDGDSPLRVGLLATKSVELTFSGRVVEMEQLSAEAVAMARRLSNKLNRQGDPDIKPLIEALNLRLVTLWRKENVAERLVIAEELDELCRIYDRPQVTLNAATFGAQAAMEAGDFETADKRMATIASAAAELRQPMVLGYALLRQAMRKSIDGELAESERLAGQAYEYSREAGQPDARAFYMGQIFNLRFHQGRLAEFVDEFAPLADEYPGIVAFRAANAMVAMEIGDEELARRSLDAIFGAGGTGVPNDLNWMATTAFATQAAAAIGDKELTRRLIEELEPWRHLCVDNASTFFGSVERFIALGLAALGDVDEAARRFAIAAQRHEEQQAWVLLARTRLEWGELLAASQHQGNLDQAEDLLAKALDGASAYDLGAIHRRGELAIEQLRSAAAGVG